NQEVVTSASQNISTNKATISNASLSNKSESSVTDPIKDNAIKSKVQTDSTQQAKANIHPYRTTTQHYPSMNTSPASTRSAENAEKTADKSVASSLDASINNQADKQDSLSKSGHKEDIAAGHLPAQGLEHYLQEQ